MCAQAPCSGFSVGRVMQQMGRVRHPLPRTKTGAPEALLLLIHVCGMLELRGHSPWSSVQHHGMLRVQGHSRRPECHIMLQVLQLSWEVVAVLSLSTRALTAQQSEGQPLQFLLQLSMLLPWLSRRFLFGAGAFFRQGHPLGCVPWETVGSWSLMKVPSVLTGWSGQTP